MGDEEQSILVFVPDSLDIGVSGYLKGRRKCLQNSEVFYITSDKPSQDAYQSIGFIGEKNELTDLDETINLYISSVNGKVSVKSCNDENKTITQIVYDYKRFKNSNIVYKNPVKYGQHFMNLCKDLRKRVHSVSENGKDFISSSLLFIISIINFCINILSKLNHVVQKSSTFTHFEESLKSIRWFLSSALEEKSITPKMGNVLIGKPIDIAIGVFLTGYVMQYEDQIFAFVHNSIEGIISNLRGLLLYLMGSPIGLKLNYGFNNFLGQFFLYHISLWRIFLHGAYPVLTNNFRFFVLPGIFGLSYQIAMVSDVIAIATFHSYCIYVNAARMFNLQLRFLRSLWRVLIGRKFNPLRNRVDSCQYSQNQLFIGTLSFTILLFLLPTTTMYYVVFSVFRLVTLFIDRLLLAIRNILYNIPIYTTFLWVVNSSSVAGNVHIAWKSYDDEGNVNIEAKLEKLPLVESIRKFTPDSVSSIQNQKTLANIFHSSITGTVL